MKSLKIIALLSSIALTIPSAPVSAAPMIVYQGVLGNKSEVVMELSANSMDGVRAGRYFYRRHGVDIPLRGTPQSLAEGIPLNDIGDAADSEEIDEPENDVFRDPRTHKPRVVWSGRLDGERYAGKWRDLRTGKSLPFNLKRVATYDPEGARATGVEAVTDAIVQGVSSGLAPDIAISIMNTPYDFLRVQSPMTPGKEVVLGKVAYRMVTDPRTRVPYPRLTRHPNAEMLARTNRLLEQRHWAMNLEALACASSIYLEPGHAAGSLGSYDEESISVEYLSPTLMSVVESGSTYCGGAHPNNHYDPYTLDLLKGGYFDFSRIIRRDKYGEDHAHFLQEALRHNPNRVRPDDTECTDTFPNHLHLHFTAPDKLSFVVSGVGHALGYCLGPYFTLRFRDLHDILKPESARYLGEAW